MSLPLFSSILCSPPYSQFLITFLSTTLPPLILLSLSSYLTHRLSLHLSLSSFPLFCNLIRISSISRIRHRLCKRHHNTDLPVRRSVLLYISRSSRERCVQRLLLLQLLLDSLCATVLHRCEAERADIHTYIDAYQHQSIPLLARWQYHTDCWLQHPPFGFLLQARAWLLAVECILLGVLNASSRQEVLSLFLLQHCFRCDYGS